MYILTRYNIHTGVYYTFMHEFVYIFYLQTNSGNPVPSFREAVKENFGVMPHNESIATTLLPGVRVSVAIGFQPRVAKNYVSLILIR